MSLGERSGGGRGQTMQSLEKQTERFRLNVKSLGKWTFLVAEG